MDPVILFYGAAVAWFSHTCFQIAALIYQFATFPRTFGSAPCVSLRTLAQLAADRQTDLPSFKIAVPAYLEASVIEGTLRRLAAINYPRTHFEVYIATYADEPASGSAESTDTVVQRVAEEINGESRRSLLRPRSVPAGFDGYFPGSLHGSPRLIGKARGLNFALRTIHEENERDERGYFIGRMSRIGQLRRADEALAAMARAQADGQDAAALADSHFDRSAPRYVGALCLSRQLQTALDLALGLDAGDAQARRAAARLLAYVEAEAPRFFLALDRSGEGDGRPTLRPLPGKAFLGDVMRAVEAEAPAVLEARSLAREATLQRERPFLHRALAEADDGDTLFQLVRRMNARWLAIYDADADAPADVLRYLAARILLDPSLMGFQGPVAPVANYDAIHPLCRLGGLWMGFWHNTSYPRLMHKMRWAHPLAGTNWCFRIDGQERDGRLVRDVPYDESRRRFLLTFDPRQLTEDLEAGVRIFSDWQINAEWHPYLELEQAPPTPGALVTQRTRWTLGTLQTLHYIVRSRLPLLQKTRFVLHPVEIMTSGSGPLVTLVLWALIATGRLVALPVFTAWTAVLTVGNLLYVVSFLAAFERFDGGARRARTIAHLQKHGRALAEQVRAGLRDGRAMASEAGLLRGIADRLDRGLAPDGFLSSALAERCLDDDAAGAAPSESARLVEETPTLLRRGDFEALAGVLREAAAASGTVAGPDGPNAAGNEALAAGLAALDDALREGEGSSPASRARRNRHRLAICLWTFPYLLFQLVPYFNGLLRWLVGTRDTEWHKTPRTPNPAMPR